MELWVCDRCHKVFTREADKVFHDHDIVGFSPSVIIQALNMDSGKRNE